MFFNLKRSKCVDSLFNSRKDISICVRLNHLHINKSHCVVQTILEKYEILISFIFMCEKYFSKQGFYDGSSIFWFKDRDILDSAFSVTSK